MAICCWRKEPMTFGAAEEWGQGTASSSYSVMQKGGGGGSDDELACPAVSAKLSFLSSRGGRSKSSSRRSLGEDGGTIKSIRSCDFAKKWDRALQDPHGPEAAELRSAEIWVVQKDAKGTESPVKNSVKSMTPNASATRHLSRVSQEMLQASDRAESAFAGGDERPAPGSLEGSRRPGRSSSSSSSSSSGSSSGSDSDGFRGSGSLRRQGAELKSKSAAGRKRLGSHGEPFASSRTLATCQEEEL